MNKVTAILNIAKEARSERASRTAMVRLQRSLRVLGCTQLEIASLMMWFDYWDADMVPYMDKVQKGPQ